MGIASVSSCAVEEVGRSRSRHLSNSCDRTPEARIHDALLKRSASTVGKNDGTDKRGVRGEGGGKSQVESR
jgi:hypothetical protein